jgi:murein DD-endopeptidase MepM/ murein hydrolase activator NlpD
MSKRYIFVIGSLVVVGFIFGLRTTRLHHSPDEFVEVLSGELDMGDSLYVALKRGGVPPAKIALLEDALKPVFNVKRCHPGDGYELVRYPDGRFASFKYQTSPVDIWVVRQSESGKLVASKEKVSLEKSIVGMMGSISSSLYESMLKEGQNGELAMRFADIFAWKIDFLTEPRPGDRFRLIWERYAKDGKPLIDGRILAAQYEASRGTYTAIFFEDHDGHKGYYDIDGRSLRRRFLRSPLHYRRISSYFSRRRFHPILKIYRPHLGIDYAAPVGTPVVTVGDGVVEYCGWKGGYGRFVKIHHNRTFSTTYGHLSRFARGIQRGVKVSQGQVIGYVGSSGLSTGPHLDFRVIRSGRFVNFLALDIPAAESVKPGDMADFCKVKERRLEELNGLQEVGCLASIIESRERG